MLKTTALYISFRSNPTSNSVDGLSIISNAFVTAFHDFIELVSPCFSPAS